jgi:hypothetical protein
MPKFLITASYTVEASRIQSRGAAHAVTRSGKDMPSNQAAAAVALAVNATGGAAVKTTVLLPPEEVDAAAEQSVSYRAPGQ